MRNATLKMKITFFRLWIHTTIQSGAQKGQSLLGLRLLYLTTRWHGKTECRGCDAGLVCCYKQLLRCPVACTNMLHSPFLTNRWITIIITYATRCRRVSFYHVFRAIKNFSLIKLELAHSLTKN